MAETGGASGGASELTDGVVAGLVDVDEVRRRFALVGGPTFVLEGPDVTADIDAVRCEAEAAALLGEDGIGSLRCAWRASFFRAKPVRDGGATSEALSASLLAGSVVSEIRGFFFVGSTSGVRFVVALAGRGVDALLGRADTAGFAAFVTSTAPSSLSSSSGVLTALRLGRTFFTGRASTSESDSLALVALACVRGGEESGELRLRAWVLAHS